MLKGTYEHADTFIQRDVNPVGIWRPVKLGLHKGLRSAERAAIDTSVTENSSARVSVSWPVILDDERGKADFTVRILSDACGTTAAHVSKRVDLGPGRSDLSASVSLDSPKLWSTWDRGEPNLYRAELCVQAPGMAPLRASETFGIRTVELRRSDRETTFLLNGRPIFLRGTNYFPDAYLSALDRSRYERDLSAIVRAGMNAVRVHVHVENEEFYELCDRMGLVVMQDSDLNWLYPTSESFCRRAVSVFEAMIKKLRNHPSVICWVCQNEPHGRAESRMHKLRPGPQLQEAATRLTPSHPVIRSSDVDDPHSGDSHNYTGSLNGHDSHYTDILGAEEKLNTEFGFDAPPSAEQVRQVPEITERLARVLPHVAELHNYQYRLTKHYIEHYRVQKYDPCSGYFQFMWIDLCPQSFYGIYDWWGLPKAEGLGGGLRALKESNMPVAVFLANEQRPVTLWVVNDTLDDLGECSLDWLVKGDDDTIAGSGETAVRIDPDSRVRAGDLALPLSPEDCREVTLTLRDPNGTVLAWNLYTDPFKHPPHPEGHPHRVDHEIGIRLYWGG
jgi:beta-galactosidase/beta-glucuronidase